jgi:carbon-monoxide dehydrogenase large subunit
MSAAFKGRREDRRLITGSGRYTADWNQPGQLYAAFLRSDRAHAEIVSIDTKAALAQPGVAGVFTAEDTKAAGLVFPPPFIPYPGKGGQLIKAPAHGILASGRVRYVGEEIAMVVADTAAAAQDAVERIEIEYRDLPMVADVEDALKPGAPQIHPEIPGNVSMLFDYGDEAKVNEAMARAAHVTRIKLYSARLVSNPMEPKGCLAVYDAARDVWDFWSSTQGITMMAGSLASFGLPPGKVRIHAQDVGGGFGTRGGAYPEYLVVLLAAKKLGKPVKWVASRSETIVSDHHGRAIRLSGALALDKDGNFLAFRLDWTCDLGAYPAGAGPFINTITPKLTPTGVYKTPAVYGLHHLVVTNTTPIAPYRGAGRPDGAYLIERLVEEAAREMGIDRLELRRRNFIPKDAFPYKTPTMVPYDSGDYANLLEKAVQKTDWAGFEARRAESKSRGKLRGIGLASFIEPAGAALAPKDQTLLKFGSSGNLVLHSVTGPSGQGHETVMPEIVGRALGVDPELITLSTGDPDGPPLIGGGTAGSRSMSSHGAASLMAAREVIKKGMDLAAKDLEVAAADIEFKDGKYSVKGTDKSIGIIELAKKQPGTAGSHPMDAGGEVPAAGTFPSGVHVAEVEIDPDTGVTSVLHYVTMDDCGTVINHTLLEGQMHGGIMQGAGQVFGEECQYDRTSGQLLTGSFMDYYMPRAGLIRDLQVYDSPVPSPTNPLGVKGAGEAGTTGSLPTFMNAVVDALRPIGIHHIDMPITPSKMWHAIRAQQRK